MNDRGKKIQRCAERIAKAEAAMESLLKRLFPGGSTVRCYLMHGQVNPTKGDVIGHPGGRYGYLTLRLHSRARIVRDVPACKVW
jgi:hypothetical protein